MHCLFVNREVPSAYHIAVFAPGLIWLSSQKEGARWMLLFIRIYSPGLLYADLKKTGVIKVESVAETVNDLRAVAQTHANTVVPDGPYVFGMLR